MSRGFGHEYSASLLYTGEVEDLELLTVAEAAKRTGYSQAHIRWALKQGDLKGRRLPPATWIIDATDLDAWDKREKDPRGWTKGKRRPPRYTPTPEPTDA